jgi:hypothetical protein
MFCITAAEQPREYKRGLSLTEAETKNGRRSKSVLLSADGDGGETN